MELIADFLLIFLIHISVDLLGPFSSPLSISLASSDGLSTSLRSTTELRNLQPSTSGVFDQQQQQQQQHNPQLQRQSSIHDDSIPIGNAQPITYKKK